MHPGNYFAYDLMQQRSGCCAPDRLATRVLTRVVGHYKATGMLLVDMGWTGCTKQGMADGAFDGCFDGHPELRVKVLKQEAGEVEAVEGATLDFAKYPIGTILSMKVHVLHCITGIHSRQLFQLFRVM